jgi:hypothetical protein
MAEAIAAIGLVVGLVGTSKQMKAQKKAAQLEQKRAEGAQRQTNVEAEQARRKALRERMIAQGQVANQGANSGVGLGGTSGFQGAMSSISSQFSSNISDINRSEGSSIAMANVQSNINQSMNKADQWSKISSFGGTLMSNAESIEKAGRSIFNKPKIG